MKRLARLIELILILAVVASGCTPTSTPTLTKLAPSASSMPEATATATIIPTVASPTPTSIPASSDLVWFAPNFGSQGFIELFTHPEQWAEARSRVNVFQFYADNVADGGPCSICGKNSLEAFIRADAFRKLTDWGIAIGIEYGPIYPDWDCTGNAVYSNAGKAIRNIRKNGGTVTFLSMDEPLMYGQLDINGKRCGYDVEKTASVTAGYIERLTSAYPNLSVGDIEPYPHFSVAELEEWILALEAQGVSPAFFHLDVDIERVRVEKSNLAADLKALEQFCNERDIPFGVIITSNWTAARSDETYFRSALKWTETIYAAMGKPRHVIFQSWQGPAPSGAHEIPSNLPENDPNIFSHTRLIVEGMNIFLP